MSSSEDSQVIVPAEHVEILHRLGCTSPNRIGAGTQSSVYKLDEERVVKIGSSSVARMERLVPFLEGLEAAKLPFETPRVLEHGVFETSVYSVERIVAGHSLRSVFRGLDGKQRDASIREVFEVLRALHQVAAPDEFGEQFAISGSIGTTSWREYVERRTRQQFALHRRMLQSDVPDIEQTLDRFLDETVLLDDVVAPSIVHGDLFFPNIMALSDGTITGLIDFSDLTLFGDPMLDFVSLAIFARVDEARDFLNSSLLDLFGHYFLARKRLYSIFYAFRFSGCKATDQETYEWCLNQFRNFSVDTLR